MKRRLVWINGLGWRLHVYCGCPAGVEVVPGRQLPWFASERKEKRGLK